jgi:hypothetical protein
MAAYETSTNAKFAESQYRKSAGIPSYSMPEMWESDYTRRGETHRLRTHRVSSVRERFTPRREVIYEKSPA